MVTSKFSKKQIKLQKAFKPTKPFEELLKTFRKMKNCFDEGELANQCLILVQALQKEENRDQDARLFTKKVNKMLLFGNDDNCPNCFLADNFHFLNANVLNSMGSSCIEANEYEEGLNYLIMGNKILTSEFDEADDVRCVGNCVLIAKATNFCKLHKIAMFTNKLDEAAAYAIKHLEIKEKLVEEGCMEIALANMDVFYAYGGAMKYRDAIPYGRKALGIQTRLLGNNSVKVANMRFNLSFMYRQLGEHVMANELEDLSDKVLDCRDTLLKAGMCEKAIRALESEVSRACIMENEQTLNLLCMASTFNKMIVELFRLSMNGLERMGRNSLWVSTQIATANILIQSGRNEEGLDAFKSILPLTKTEAHQGHRACSFTIMARGSFNLGKFSDARKYMKIAARVIEKRQISPVLAATAFFDMSRVYEDMNEYEPAISNLRRALAIPELPQENLIDSCSMLFSLISVTGKEKKGIPYLEEAVERLKEKLGPDHCQVGYGYSNLGIAFMNSGQTESAVKLMADAKNILDVSLGSHHLVSLQTSQILSINYADLGSYELAIEIQEKVVQGYKSLGPREQELLEEAVIYLDKLKGAAAESPTSSSPQSLDDVAVLSETMSNCAISVQSKTSTLFDRCSCKQLPILYKRP